MLLARAFVTVEGVCRRLDPTFNMVEQARPVIAGILRDRFAPSAVASRISETGREMAEGGAPSARQQSPRYQPGTSSGGSR